ncbi:unnamed protein product, partial [marine sediment metagenome]
NIRSEGSKYGMKRLVVIILILLITTQVFAGLDAKGGKVVNVASPTEPCDVATKYYVDGMTGMDAHDLLWPVSRGSLIVGNSTPSWDDLVLGAAGTILRSDGTDCGWAATTNITALGTIATGTWQATDVGVLYGGTGVSTLTDGGILLGSGTGAITALGVASNGQIPIGDGTTDPVLATITAVANETDVTNAAGSITIGIVDPLAVAKGGTGASSLNDLIALGTDTTGNYAAGDGEAGNALTGDSATAFFSSGTIELARAGLGADLSGFTGLLAITGGSVAEIDALSELEGQVADVTAFVVEETACSDIEGTGLSITAGTLNWACPADGINNTHINWGSGAGQVDTDDIPEGSTNLYQLAEEEVEDYVGTMLAGVETLISVDYNDTSNMIDFVVDEANIDHDALTNFVAAEHYDWTNETHDVNTAGSGRFDGGIGVGADPSSAYLINIEQTLTSDVRLTFGNLGTGDIQFYLYTAETDWSLGIDNSDKGR